MHCTDSGGQARRRELQNYLRRCEDAILASVETWEPRLEQDLFGIYWPKDLWLSMFHLNYTPGFRFDRLKGEYINVEDDWISGEISKSLMGKIVCHFWPTHSKTFFPTHLVDRSQLIFYLVPVPQDFHSQAGSTTHLGENVMAITAARQARTTSRQRPLWVRCTPALLPDNPLPSEEKNYRMCNVLVM